METDSSTQLFKCDGFLNTFTKKLKKLAAFYLYFCMSPFESGLKLK